MRFVMTYDKLDIAFTENDNNILILGTGGSGKTAMIKK
jgi:DNA replication protein DnaC